MYNAYGQVRHQSKDRAMLDITIYSPKLFKINQLNNNSLISDAISYKLHYKCSELYSMSDIKVSISSEIAANKQDTVDLAVSNVSVKMKEKAGKHMSVLLKAEVYDAIDAIINKTFQRYSKSS